MDSIQFEQWFDALYFANAKNMAQVAYRIVGSREAAEDIVQNVFIVLLAKKEAVSKMENQSAWLYQTLRNQIGNELKRKKYRQTQSLDESVDLASFDVYFEELALHLPRGLSEKEREILVMRFEEQMSLDEIAERLGISYAAAGTRLSRAKVRCKNYYKSDEEEVKQSKHQDAIPVGGEGNV